MATGTKFEKPRTGAWVRGEGVWEDVAGVVENWLLEAVEKRGLRRCVGFGFSISRSRLGALLRSMLSGKDKVGGSIIPY